MQNGRRNAGIAVGAVLVACASLLLFSDREPRYDGKPLSFWIDQISTDPQAAKQALRGLGSEAVPHLIRDLRKRDTLVFLDWLSPASSSHHRAMDVCRILGPDAKDALPALTELLELPDSHHDVVVMTMERIGTDAVPYLASILPRLQGRPARLSVVMALGRMEPGKLRAHEEIVAPALVNCLADPDWNMRNHAYAALFAFSPEGKHTVPALLRLLRDKPLLSDLGDDAQDAIHRAQRHLDRLAPETRLEPVRADLD